MFYVENATRSSLSDQDRRHHYGKSDTLLISSGKQYKNMQSSFYGTNGTLG